ncbi:MAG: glycosyltransferase family 2 protein [Candidatus Lernaella stagnicola]|nr:glycosyltransferase family 2 protein [Candidatus Lernaella stagnicola]
MMPPLVSVLMPARDEALRVADALSDLMAQTLTDVEILVLDDGSTDDTSAVARRTAGNDQRVRVITLPARGIVATLNEGLAAAHGAFIARMDADDRCAPNRLEAQIDLLHSRPDLALASCLIAPPVGESYAGGYQAYAKWVNSLVTPEAVVRERFIECPVVHPTMVTRRDVLREHGGWRDGDFPEDYDLILRLLADGAAMAKVESPLYFWRDHANRASRVDPRYAPAAFYALKAEFLSQGPLCDAPEIVVCGAGRLSRKHVRPLQRLGHHVRAWLDIDPKKIGICHAGAPVLHVERLREVRAWPLLVYVGTRGARELIRPRLQEAGFEEGRDAWFCA